MIKTAGTFALIIILAAMVITFIRMVKGPSLPDKVVALDLMAFQAYGFIIVFSLMNDEAAFLDIVLISALVIYLGTITVAMYLNRTL